MLRKVLLTIVILYTNISFANSFQQNAVERQRPIIETVIESKVLGEELSLFIHLPLFYGKDFSKNYQYPVLYVLDAPDNLPLYAGVLASLTGYNSAPQPIIVGISTNNRDREFLPSIDKNYGTDGGGANKFLQYIREEVIPYIDVNYRTEPYRIISGHSYGGLFVAHAFSSSPALFQAHFAFSPSLFWDNSKTVDSLISFIKNNPTHKNYLYMNIGNEGDPKHDSPEGKQMLQGIKNVDKALKTLDMPNLKYQLDYLANESHQTTQIIGAINSLRGLYPQWSIPYKASLAGYDSVIEHFTELTKRYGYPIEPKRWQMYDEGVYHLNGNNNPTEALKYFHYNIKRDPEDLTSRRFLVDAYIALNDKSSALSDLEFLLEKTKELEEKQKLIELKNTLLK